MSHYSLMGATIVPSAVVDPFTFFDGAAIRIDVSSRSGQFHSAMRSVLNATIGYEGLRFLSAEKATRKEESSDGTTLFTLLVQSELAVVEITLTDLLERMPEYIESLPDHLLTDWGGAFEVQAGLSSAFGAGLESIDRHSLDEGDSPEFFFRVLKSLTDLVRAARDGDSRVVIYNWMPK